MARIRIDRCRIRGAQWVNISLLRTCPARIRMGRAPRGKPLEFRVDMGMPQGNIPIFSPRMACLPMARVHMDRTPNIRTLTSPIQVPRGRLQLLRAPLLKAWRRRVNIVATQLLRAPPQTPVHYSAPRNPFSGRPTARITQEARALPGVQQSLSAGQHPTPKRKRATTPAIPASAPERRAPGPTPLRQIHCPEAQSPDDATAPKRSRRQGAAASQNASRPPRRTELCVL